MATGNIMATLENLTNFDFGCTAVSLVRTGQSSGYAWDSIPANKLTEKVFRIVPANSNGAASYKVTLYYTKDEIAGWQLTTGNQLSDLRMVRSNDNIAQLAAGATPTFLPAITSNDYGVKPDQAVSAISNGAGYFALGKFYVKSLCPGRNIRFITGLPGSAYQWQADNGTGYTNIANSAVIQGATGDTLELNVPPTSWYGTKYRCIVTTAYGTMNSQEFELKFGMTWQGSNNSDWDNPANWPCNVLPDENTDVMVNGATNIPMVNSNAVIRSLQVRPSANVLIKAGSNLTIRK